ncbi:hypothetical protein J2S43_001796 [Catenuloplanes nepalensis]|uniref:Small EDRK-rich factor-like N-terminal domain-containing protein n=1 Tax=Catenuloplanes nepalensis TaxID=587533 RepID=A0ABT9MPD2_9ACTN|nr:hypothetical protein [Catenuloplanes nepalensis]MDP9793284.1 hypothetical protein [Catenuloplanes nepalensis]
MVRQPSDSLGRRPGRGKDSATLEGRTANQSEAAQRRQSLAEKMRARTSDADKRAEQDGATD